MNNVNPSLKEMYDALAYQIEREDNLVNNRVNWFLVTQGFLFAAVGVILGSELTFDTKVLFVKAIAVLGALMGIIIALGVLGAEIALEKLREHWTSNKNCLSIYFPPPCGGAMACFFGCLPRRLIPVLITCAWAIVFRYLLRNPNSLKTICEIL